MKISKRRIEAALDTLGDLSGSDEPEIGSRERDEIASIRFVMEQILDRREQS